jgi:hypothetical protein
MANKFINISRVDNQGDRVLLFGKSPDYHVIASPEDGVQVGDEIEFEPYGWNFGWFKRKVDTRA